MKTTPREESFLSSHAQLRHSFGTAFERLVDGGIQPRVESDDLRTDPFWVDG